MDRELVTRKLSLILADLGAIEALARKSRDEYLASATDELVAERLLERVIGRMIDINYHLLVSEGQPPPADYYDSFLKLGALGALPHDFARRIAACAGLRNRIAHEYNSIDPAKVHEALQGGARDIPEYLGHIHRFVEGPAGAGPP